MSINVIPYKKYSYFKIAKMQSNCILELRMRCEWLKTGLIALLLFTICTNIGLLMAINKIEKEPITVQLEDKTVDLSNLPLPPLKELEIK